MNASKVRLGPKQLDEVLEGIRHVWVAKGKKVTRLDLTREPQPVADLEAALLGPTGNLRAPTLRIGKTLLVGFGEELYAEVLGD